MKAPVGSRHNLVLIAPGEEIDFVSQAFADLLDVLAVVCVETSEDV
jgi:hypothetical protein